MKKNLKNFFGSANIGVGLALLALGVFTSVSQADLYDIGFTDGGANNVGSGQIDVESGLAVSGFFNVTVGSAIGNYTLAPAAGSDGSYAWDNVVNVGSNPFLTDNGLLFTSSSSEINLLGTGANAYSLYGNINANFNNFLAQGTATLTPVPEPINLSLLVFGVVFVVGSIGRFYLGSCRSATAS